MYCTVLSNSPLPYEVCIESVGRYTPVFSAVCVWAGVVLPSY